jgi:type II secretory pathway component PulM
MRDTQVNCRLSHSKNSIELRAEAYWEAIDPRDRMTTSFGAFTAHAINIMLSRNWQPPRNPRRVNVVQFHDEKGNFLVK